MNMKKNTFLKIYFLLFIVIFLLLTGKNINAEIYSDNGFIARINYSPFGIGKIRCPYMEEKIGSVYTESENTNKTLTSKNYTASLAYYHDFFLCQFSFTDASVYKQYFETDKGNIHNVNTDSRIWDLKIGRRFSIKGSPGYTLFYINGKILRYTLSYRKTEFTAYGYSAGYEGFYTFGLKHQIEFAFATEIYYGIYQSVDYSSEIDCVSTRQYSYSGGAMLGAGIWYDPWDTAFMLTTRAIIDQVAFNADHNSKNFTVEAGFMALNFGFEIIYHFAFNKYNQEASQ